jgi:phospholipid-binding lipoprotein MlaA
MPVRRLPYLFGWLLAAGLTLSGCAGQGPSGGATAAAAGPNDPLEDANRAIFSFNQGVDEAVLVPVAKTYRTVVPPPVRQSLHDFMQNLNEPVIFANDVLQARPADAGETLARFAINTTAGIGGMFDVASRLGIPYHSNDLGVTLANWGIDSGPYLVIPVLGPSNVRDLAGRVGDGFADPGNIIAGDYNLMWASVARAVAEGIDTRSRNIENLAQIQRTSLDYYATIRSLYEQRRAAEVRHEQSNLPNPGLGGDSSGSEPAMSYTVGAPAQPQGPAR